MRLTVSLAVTAALFGLSAAAAAQDIVVGQIAPLSGTQAAVGQAAYEGAKLYFDLVNKRGGLNGRKLAFVAKDDAYKPEQTVQQVRALMDERSPVLFINTVGTAHAEALAKSGLLANSKTSLLGPTSGAKSMYSTPYVYPVRASYEKELVKLLEQMTAIGVTRLAVVYQDDQFGREGLTSVKGFATTHPGLQVVAELPYARGVTDLKEAAKLANAANVQAVVLCAVTQPAVSFIQAFRVINTSASLAVMSTVDTDTLETELKQQARGIIMGAVMPHPRKTSNILIQEIELAATEVGRRIIPTPRFVLGYATAKVAVMAMRSVRGPLTAETVSRALQEANSFAVTPDLRVNYKGPQTGANYLDVGMVGERGFMQ